MVRDISPPTYKNPTTRAVVSKLNQPPGIKPPKPFSRSLRDPQSQALLEAYQAMTPLKSSKYKKQDIPVLIRNARVAALTKDFSAAHQWLDICHELHPTDLEVMEARGEIFQQMGLSEDALAVYSSALQHDPWQPQIYMARARIYRDQRKIPSAIDEIKKALKIEGTDNVEPRISLGECYFDDAQYEEASATLCGVLRLQPRNAKANFLHALCLEECGSHLDAQRKFAAVAAMDPSFANSLVEASHRASKLKQIPQAIMFLQQALRLLPTDDGLNLELGRLLTTVHDHTGAVKAFGKCIEHAPHVPTYQLERGRSNFAGVRNYWAAKNDFSAYLDMVGPWARAPSNSAIRKIEPGRVLADEVKEALVKRAGSVLRLKAGGRERFALVSADIENLVAANCSLKEAQTYDKQLHLLFARLFVNQLRKKPMSGNLDEFASELGARAKDCSSSLWEAYKQGVPLRLCHGAHLAALTIATVHRAELLASLRPANADGGSGSVHHIMPLKLMCAIRVAEMTAPAQADGANVDLAFATLLTEVNLVAHAGVISLCLSRARFDGFKLPAEHKATVVLASAIKQCHVHDTPRAMEHLQKRDPLKLLSLAELAIVEIGSALDNEAYSALATTANFIRFKELWTAASGAGDKKKKK